MFFLSCLGMCVPYTRHLPIGVRGGKGGGCPNDTSRGCEVPYVHTTSSPPGKLPRAPFQGRQELDLPVIYTPVRSNPGETLLWPPGHVRELHPKTIPPQTICQNYTPKLYAKTIPQNYTPKLYRSQASGPKDVPPLARAGNSPNPFRACKTPSLRRTLHPELHDSRGC